MRPARIVTIQEGEKHHFEWFSDETGQTACQDTVATVRHVVSTTLK